jgi:hypothetical protein
MSDAIDTPKVGSKHFKMFCRFAVISEEANRLHLPLFSPLNHLRQGGGR